mgnify:CR=1 FL=1
MRKDWGQFQGTGLPCGNPTVTMKLISGKWVTITQPNSRVINLGNPILINQSNYHNPGYVSGLP